MRFQWLVVSSETEYKNRMQETVAVRLRVICLEKNTLDSDFRKICICGYWTLHWTTLNSTLRAGCVALCYDGFSENPKLSNVELG